MGLRYDCKGKDIYRYIDGSPDHPGDFMVNCPLGCFELASGAACLDRAPPSKRADEGMSAYVNTMSNKYTECTSDYRGVRTCEYGFCYVVPGDWCKASESCRNDCNCCKKNKRLSRRFEHRDTTEQAPSEEHKPLDNDINEWKCSKYDEISSYVKCPLTMPLVVGKTMCVNSLLKCDKTGHLT